MLIVKNKGDKNIKKFYQLNQYIKADKLRVIDADGEQIGVMPKDEALFKARQAGKDLVLMAENAKPPVAKIIDFKKFQYQQAKKQKASKKKTPEQKEVRFSPFIAENDFNVRIKRAKEFIKEGDSVKLTVKFKGAQMARKQFGHKVLNKALKQLEKIASKTTEPKWLGRMLTVTVVPK